LKDDDKSCSTVVFEKQAVAHLVKKFSSLIKLKRSLSFSKKKNAQKDIMQLGNKTALDVYFEHSVKQI